MTTDYEQWLVDNKIIVDLESGIDVAPDAINPILFDFQRDIVRWALKRGRAAIFASTGLGKTPQLLEWSYHIPGRVLILSPLAVAEQTVNMAHDLLKMNDVKYLREDDHVTRIIVTNYEMLDNFDPKQFTGVVCDEISIVKNYAGAFRNHLIEWSVNIPYKLGCSATPSPNSHDELLNVAEYLGIMRYNEALATFFINDTVHTAQWRLKKHGRSKFWEWCASWSVFLNNPSDLGYDGSQFVLPPLNVQTHYVSITDSDIKFDGLWADQVSGLTERRDVRRKTIPARLEQLKKIIGDSTDQWLIWVDLNDEADAIKQAFPHAIEVRGSDSIDSKVKHLTDFAKGKIQMLITKPKIAAQGLNLQSCKKMAFYGLSDSMEAFYQAVRRCWRFGQTMPVDVHVIVSELEQVVVDNVAHKEAQMIEMQQAVVQYTKKYVKENITHGVKREVMDYKRETVTGKNWTMHLGDSCEVIKEFEDNSIDYSVYSPPFMSLYTYSNSERDMGNCRSSTEFYDQFKFLAADLFRVIKPGRLMSFHCMDLPTTKFKDGFIGLTDFPGDLTRMFQEVGFIYHSKSTIVKDPVTAMQRTKALGLLHKQLKKDSSMCRNGIADYLVTMRKPGINAEPIAHTADEFPVSVWQKYAQNVWPDINPSNTLQHRSARENNDERHICPLSLDVIEMSLKMWTNPGDLVLSPFAGIGSEGFQSLKMGRRFVGIELKEVYMRAACKNLSNAHADNFLFDYEDLEVVQ